jgi:uncharacterized protein (DUF433 family)
MVSVVLADIAAGEPFESIISGYHIERDDIQAALYYAADLAHDRFLPLTEAGRDALQNR